MAQLRIQKRKNSIKPLQIIFKSDFIYNLPRGYKSMDVFLVGGGGGADGVYQYESHTIRAGSGAGGGRTGTTKLIDVVEKSQIDVHIGIGGRGGSGCQVISYSEDSYHEYKDYYSEDGGATSLEYQVNEQSSQSIIVIGGKRSIATQDGSVTGGDGGSGGGATAASSRKTITPYAGVGGSNGGNGANSHYYYSGAERTDVLGGVGQGRTTRAFEEQNGTLYAGGGGAGASRVETNTAYVTSSATSGGSGGGGAGGRTYGSSGSPNTGGGGGGGGYVNYSFSVRQGGNGGSGVAIIRLYKNHERPADIDWSDKTIIVGG